MTAPFSRGLDVELRDAVLYRAALILVDRRWLAILLVDTLWRSRCDRSARCSSFSAIRSSLNFCLASSSHACHDGLALWHPDRDCDDDRRGRYEIGAGRERSIPLSATISVSCPCIRNPRRPDRLWRDADQSPPECLDLSGRCVLFPVSRTHFRRHVAAGLVATYPIPADIIAVGIIASVVLAWRVHELVEKPILKALGRRRMQAATA